MKIAWHYTPRTYLDNCTTCGETNLHTDFGDEIINGQTYCAACAHRLRTTERSEGVRPTERSEGGSA
jgi:hypothetical protein